MFPSLCHNYHGVQIGLNLSIRLVPSGPHQTKSVDGIIPISPDQFRPNSSSSSVVFYSIEKRQGLATVITTHTLKCYENVRLFSISKLHPASPCSSHFHSNLDMNFSQMPLIYETAQPIPSEPSSRWNNMSGLITCGANCTPVFHIFMKE